MNEQQMGETCTSLLRQSLQFRPPVNLNSVRSVIPGLRLNYDDKMPDSVDGYLLVKGRYAMIGINPRHGLCRQRFSLGHELYHLFDKQAPASFWMKGCAHCDRNVERAANQFSATLLMPSEWVQDAWFTTQDFDYLRRLFIVSKRAMSLRLKDLGIDSRN